jgi:hypothetical protein
MSSASAALGGTVPVHTPHLTFSRALLVLDPVF